MDAYWNSSFNSQLHLYQFSSNLGLTLILLQEAANTVLGRAATQRAPDRVGKWNNGNLTRLDKGKCKNLHLERKSKTSQAPWGWQVAQRKSPWELPSLPDLLEIPKQWHLLTSLGFPSQLSLQTHPVVRLQGSPDQASEPQRLLCALLLHQPFLRAGFCSHLALKGLMAVLYSYLSITDTCNSIQDQN